MPYITTHDHQQLFYRDLGRNTSSSQAPIVLLHGFGMNSLHWLPFTLPFKSKQRFIIPDFRGFGRSHHLTHDRDCVISNYADDLHSLMSQLSLQQVKLAGISMGAVIALKYQGVYGDNHIQHYLHIDQSPQCINDPEWQWGLFGHQNENRLIQANQLIEDLTPYIECKTPYAELPSALRKQMWKQLGNFFADAFSRKSHKHLAQRLCRHERIIQKLIPTRNWPAYIQCLRAYIEQKYDMTDVIKELQAPLTLLVGMKSDMYPCGGQLRIADHHNNCEVKAFTNSGHTPLIDQPLKFLQVLRQFAYS